MSTTPQLYRLLEEGEKIEPADIYWSVGEWRRITERPGVHFDPEIHRPHLRPVPTEWIPLVAGERPPLSVSSRLFCSASGWWSSSDDYHPGRPAATHYWPIPPLPPRDQSREEFEKAVNAIGGGTHFPRNPSGEYANVNTEFAWKIWQAASATGENV